MKREICTRCKHCLSCMCGDEFEDCFIKNPNLKRQQLIDKLTEMRKEIFGIK